MPIESSFSGYMEYEHTNSVLAVIICHAMGNVALMVEPDLKGVAPQVPCFYAVAEATLVGMLHYSNIVLESSSLP